MVRLTQYSHGAGCGCKLSPKILDAILAQTRGGAPDPKLLVGHGSRDDAAVYDIGGGMALISTTDFFMPIVDDPHTFGRIAAANAISDVYAMGGRPVLAIAILGWPIAQLDAEIAGQVVEGGRSICAEANIPLAGGHSIDSPEPIFGLAVNGLVPHANLKKNDGARPGDLLFLTKGLGIGLLTTAEKRGLLKESDAGLAARVMTELNRAGEALGALDAVTALTDITGFGLLGHLNNVCAASHTRAEIDFDRVPRIADLTHYFANKTSPGGTQRNYESYGHHVGPLTDEQRSLLCDPQTSGGLLAVVKPEGAEQVAGVFRQFGLSSFTRPIGRMFAEAQGHPRISVCS